ncbi:MAG: hypothetical protein HDS13_06890 [Bacteroides sp.]|nr:hypothetical protein [Bacteroides sp.]
MALPAVLVLLGIGSGSASEVAGGVTIGTAARSAISFLTREAAKKTMQQVAAREIGNKLSGTVVKNLGQQTTKAIITKNIQNGAINSIFEPLSQTQVINSNPVPQQTLHAAQSMQGSYRLYSQCAQAMSKMRTLNVFPKR